MDEQLNDNDLDVILDSLKHYKTNIENYGKYPSYESKQKQLERVEATTKKVEAMRQKLRQE